MKMRKTLAEAWAEGHSFALGKTMREFGITKLVHEPFENPYLDPRHTQLEAARERVILAVRHLDDSRLDSMQMNEELWLAVRELLKLETP